jgi:hypothetical protein
MFEHQGEATIVSMSSVSPHRRMETKVRWVKTTEPEPYAQYATSVTLHFKEPRGRKTYYFTVKPDNLTYYLIEVGGRVVWDSRNLVPCDMAEWEADRARFDATWKRHQEGSV